MKITAVETIPVSLPVGKFSDGIHMVRGTNASERYDTGGLENRAAVAEAADLKIVIGTEWGTGLKVAAKLHLSAAIKNADPVVEFTEMMIPELLLKEPLKLHDGYLDVPTAPGLGMPLDDEKVEAFRIDT